MPSLYKRIVTHPLTEKPGIRRVKATAKAAVFAAAKATADRRVDPDVILVGAQRCGTTALTEALYRSPVIARPRAGKGAHYFSYNFHHGYDWYRAQFPTRTYAEWIERRHGHGLVTMDACPYYLFHPFAVTRIADALPDAKLLLMLRDPVARAQSHWVHSTAHGFESLPFAEALDVEDDRLAGEVEAMRADVTYWSERHEHTSYVAKGRYAEQIEHLLELFPREQMLVVQAEAFYRDPDTQLARVTDWLGVPRMALTESDERNGYSYPSMDPEIRDRLVEEFRAPNEALFDLLGERFDWLGA